MIRINSFVFNPFMENTYILSDDTKEAIIIDPGCYDPAEKIQLENFISENGLKPVKLINTHCHIDHVLGNYFVMDKYDVPLLIHNDDLDTLRSVKVYAPSYGFDHYEDTEPQEFLKEGDQVGFGNSSLDVIFVPGHAPGHIALVNRDQEICISGDVLFHRSIGRTDLPGGNMDQLIRSIHEKMFNLPPATIVYSGHGETTTIEDEMKFNPFCAIR